MPVKLRSDAASVRRARRLLKPNALNGYQKVVGVCALMMRQIPAEVLLKL